MYKFNLARNEEMVKRFLLKDWTLNQPKDIPDKMPTIKDTVVDGFKSFKEEAELVFALKGNYLAKGVFILIIVMIFSIIVMVGYMCF